MVEMCYNCEERECADGGALCDECRADMWGDRWTHHEDERLERTAEDVARANGQM